VNRPGFRNCSAIGSKPRGRVRLDGTSSPLRRSSRWASGRGPAACPIHYVFGAILRPCSMSTRLTGSIPVQMDSRASDLEGTRPGGRRPSPPCHHSRAVHLPTRDWLRVGRSRACANTPSKKRE
jgi:hypothetical protein